MNSEWEGFNFLFFQMKIHLSHIPCSEPVSAVTTSWCMAIANKDVNIIFLFSKSTFINMPIELKATECNSLHGKMHLVSFFVSFELIWDEYLNTFTNLYY